MTDQTLSFTAASDLVRKRTEHLAELLGHSPLAYVRTFGCQQNEADSERLRGTLVLLGYQITEDPAAADCILVNTCAIREHAEIKALSSIGQYKHLKAAKPHLIIGVCGCMSAEKHRVEELKSRYPYVDFTLPPAGDAMLPSLILAAMDKKRSFSCLELREAPPASIQPVRGAKSKAWVSIMYGCNNFCSYCIVPYVRGRERSRPYAEILAECESLVLSGVKDITLLGQNVNSYSGGCSFAELITRISEIPGEFILRFMTSHPKDVTPELIEAMRASAKAARHFHLPLQSGSDDILRRMNRRYDSARYLSLVDALRSAMPEISLTTDIIVGFPGETDEDFEKTLSVIRRVRFDSIYSFIFSPRKNTPAAEMPDQIPREIQNARFDRLLALQNEIAAEKNLSAVGKTFRVLCEGGSRTDPSVLAGRTDGNLLVLFGGTAAAGEFTHVKITDAEPYALHGIQIK